MDATLASRANLVKIFAAGRDGWLKQSSMEAKMSAADYEVLDQRFSRLFNGSAQVDKLFTGCRWAEGPAYFFAGRYLVWSDIPNNRMLSYDETNGQVGVFRQHSGNSSGDNVVGRGGVVP